MREQLQQYVELLFAGAQNCEDIKQEILQNTLDRYDDLVAEGKVPEAAYRLAISGIGDINEILGTPVPSVPVSQPTPPQKANAETDTPVKKMLRAVGVGLYILCAIPVIVLSELGLEIIGLCGTLAIAAIATVMVILGARKDPEDEKQIQKPMTPQETLRQSTIRAIRAVGLAVYFLISFLTGAWYITWLVFPICGAAKELANAIFDYKEVDPYET